MKFENPLAYERMRRALVLILVIGALAVLLIENLHILGRHIPTATIGADYFRGVFTAFLLTPLIFLFPARSTEVVSLFVLWGIRCCVTLGFMLYYEYTYGLDAYHYFASAVSEIHYEAYLQEFNGTQNVIVLARFFAQNIPVLASYHALKVVWSFFGFIATYVFYRAYTRNTGEYDLKLLWILSLFPSMLFWSSILGKDPLTILGISLFFFGSIELFRRISPIHLALAAMGLAIAGLIRPWLVLVFLVPFLILYLFRSKAAIWAKAIIMAGMIFGLMQSSKGLMESTQITDADSLLDSINVVSRSWSRGGSGQHVESFNSPRAALMFLPKGAFTALFRPLPGEIRNVFGLLSGFENLILLIGILFSFYLAGPDAKRDIFIQYAFVTIVVWSLFYAFISYQNLGTAVRFKLQILPLMILIPIRMLDYKPSKQEPETGALQ